MGWSWCDLLWALAYPVYQMIGTFRHEGAHAVAAKREGLAILRFQIFPSRQNGHWYWGYVQCSARPRSVWFYSAPYVADFLTFLTVYPVCWFLRSMPHWLWLNLFVVGLLSPLANTWYNYRWAQPDAESGNDVCVLMFLRPSDRVRTWFRLALSLYLCGIVALLLSAVAGL